jgi:site-specific recombinase XerD
LLALFLGCLNAEGKSLHTVTWYRWNLGLFYGWLADGGHPRDPDRWTPDILRAYVAHCRERPAKRGGQLSPAALNSTVRAVRGYCTWLRREGLVDRNLFERVQVPRLPKLAKPTLSPAQVEALVQAARRKKRNALRNEALVLFLYDTGARAAEVCTLEERDIDWERRIAKLYGKGNKERYAPFSAHTATAMQRYHLRGRDASAWVFFQSEQGGPLGTSGLRALLKRLGERAGVDVHPHLFRHTFSTAFLRNGGSAFTLQKLLGHSTLSTTLNYVHLVTDDLVAEHEAHGPVAAMTRAKLSGRGRR